LSRGPVVGSKMTSLFLSAPCRDRGPPLLTPMALIRLQAPSALFHGSFPTLFSLRLFAPTFALFEIMHRFSAVISQGSALLHQPFSACTHQRPPPSPCPTRAASEVDRHEPVRIGVRSRPLDVVTLSNPSCEGRPQRKVRAQQKKPREELITNLTHKSVRPIKTLSGGNATHLHRQSASQPLWPESSCLGHDVASGINVSALSLFIVPSCRAEIAPWSTIG
jgi:hypothetical protein